MQHPYQCTVLRQITNDICLLEFKPLQTPIQYYVPGQYVLAHLPQNEKIALSIAGASDDILEFHVRHNASQPLAQKLLQHLSQNPVINMEGPYGDATVSQIQKHMPVIFLSGGTGFAPFQSLISAALQSAHQHTINLYWGIRNPGDAYALDLIQQWQKSHTQFNYTLVLSESVPESWHGATGLVHEFVAHQYSNLSDYQVFASGPLGMVRQAFDKFVGQGLSPDFFYTDLRSRNVSSRAG